MSLNLDSLLNNYLAETSPLRQFFWRKERQAGGVSYPLPIREQYIDFVKAVLGLHIIELAHLDQVKELKIKTSYPYNFFSVLEDLQSLFFLLTNLKIKLRVVSTSSRRVWKRFDQHSPYEKIVLFSGGVDSLCGALDLSRSHRVILSHCVTNQDIFGRVLRLSNMPPLQKSVLYCLDARKRAEISGMSETRSLLFLSSAYAIAKSLDLESAAFCENGSQMLDVMLGSLVYPNKQATKNTNLIYIKRMENIFSHFDDQDFKIELPFKNMTKAEVLYPFKDSTRMIEDTFSCFSTRFRTAMCGICFNCFIRKLSLVSIGVKEKDDTYELNPFKFSQEMSDKRSYKTAINILFHLLRFYHKILNLDSSAVDELTANARDYFEDPLSLATRFAKDVFLGSMLLLQATDEEKLNLLGKKVKDLLNLIDKEVLIERKEELQST